VSKPSPPIAFRPRLQLAEDSLRPTQAYVSLDAIAANLRTLRGLASRSGILAVVKADGYGHGVVPVVGRLAREGVAGFGVALAEEGIELRNAGVESDILVLNGVYGEAHEEVLRNRLTPVIYDLGELEAFHRVAHGRPFGVHLKVDTGMSRLGVRVDRLSAFLQGAARFTTARIEGFMTHLACADCDRVQTAQQLARFRDALALVRHHGHTPSVVHAANSAGLLRHPESHFDMVRPGIALFGTAPCEPPGAVLVPALSLRTRVIALRDLVRGETVGYGGTFRASGPTRVATVPMGYGDGLMRSLSNRGQMLVRGQRCPIVGNVSMDLTCLDVSHVADCGVGDEVVVLGRQGDGEIRAEEVAGWAGTIGYEVLTNISRRVPRVYE